MSALCKKNETILSQIPCCRSALWLYQFEYTRIMCSAISMKPHGMIQPIEAAVLETFVMMNKDGAHLSSKSNQIKSNQILFKVSNVHLKEKKIGKKLYSITNNNKLYI